MSRWDPPAEAARIVFAARELGARHGILIAVPVPEADALPVDMMEEVIRRATAEAEAEKIHGKQVTPFLSGGSPS
jgi:pseudouridine-5'-phosphate glycosidase